MKTRMLSIFSIAMIGLISCKKTEAVTPADAGSATIEGVAYAPLDLGNDTTASGVFVSGLNNEYVPAGTQITAIIDSYDLQANPDNSFNYQLLKFTAVVGNNGVFSFTGLPTYSEEIDVELRFNDFTSTQNQFDPSNNPAEEKIFTLSSKYASIYDGAIVIKEYNYSAN